MKILVFGLCLSRNLGGPAMALELIRGLKARVTEAEITFAVMETPEEELWSRRLELGITPRVNFSEYLLSHLPFSFFRFMGRISGKSIFTKKKSIRLRENADGLIQVVQESDVILNMSGIAYVGDGSLSRSHAINSYFPCWVARKYKKPYVGFVQSYGPFDDPFVRWLAKKEFRAIPFVPARGHSCAEDCRKIADPDKVYCFPDIAINLPLADPSWTKSYLRSHGLTPKDYIVVSPSAVMRNTLVRNHCSLGVNSVPALQKILEHLLRQKHSILLLPHMYYDSRPDRCDRVVCREILEQIQLSQDDKITIVQEDLDAMQAKALIAQASSAVVSRYHALVAALSTATPVISVGWNTKYADILRFYGIPQMAIDAGKHSPDALLSVFIELQQIWQKQKDELVENMKALHQKNQKLTDQAFDLLSDWLQKQS